jgi:hypothetical protein
MSVEFDTHEGGKTGFWWSQGDLVDRLSWLFPSISITDYSVESKDLTSNASFVNFVRHHRLTNIKTGVRIDLIEKSVKKVALITSLESRFYRERNILMSALHFKHPVCFGVLETARESIIFTDYIAGKPPRMRVVSPQIARGIAELEYLSFCHLSRKSKTQALKYWTMDFFRPWYLLRPRFSFHRLWGNLARLVERDDQFKGIEAPLRALGDKVKSLEQSAKSTPRCFSHMDYLRKNLFITPSGLQLIDWSEVKVGRIGFDAGSFLASSFRRSEMGRYEALRDSFLTSYEESLDPQFSISDALQNARYIFLLTALWQCMRPETIQEFEDGNRLPLLREKFEFLISHETY